MYQIEIQTYTPRHLL